DVRPLSSARRRFTVLFGMGRRGTTLLWSSSVTGLPCGQAVASLALRPILRRSTPRLRAPAVGLTARGVTYGFVCWVRVRDCYINLFERHLKRITYKVIGSSRTGN